MAWNSPISMERSYALVQELALGPGDVVVDLGCGTAELLECLCERGASGLGVDQDAALIEEAKNRAPELNLIAQDAATTLLPATTLVVCIGASHAFGDGEAALDGLAAFVRPALGEEGWLLAGLGFHRPPIPEAYAELLGTPSGIERTHAQNVRDLERHGFEVVHAISATTAEWDEFEWSFYRRRGKRAWRDAYLRWGRDVMGFGLYLARVHQPSSS